MYKILILSAFATPAFAQPEFPLPRLYTVTGVAQNDTLNIRQSPSANAPDIGDLNPSQNIEVLEVSDNGWGLVSQGESAGWVSMRYLRIMPKTMGLGPDLPYGMPSQLECSGTEPFWSVDINTGVSVTFSDYSSQDSSPKTFPMLGAARSANRGAQDYGFISTPFSGVLSRKICDDGMSGRLYGWTFLLLGMKDGQAMMRSGCCSAIQP